ncbi:MAG: peptidoglycan editing factor PgeF [Pseudomonadota bacterium]
MHPDWLVPDWPAPTNVRAVMTTRAGGVSRPPWDSLNPASHVGDDPAAVAENRRRLAAYLPSEPVWLNQVHGTEVYGCASDRPASPGEEAGRAGQAPAAIPCADASLARQPGQVCAVLTADCLPVLFCDRAGTVVAAAHAGWRGLAAGVLEATVARMAVPPEDVLAWLGVAIGPDVFEVGEEVRQAFIDPHPLAAVAFRPALPGTLDEAPRQWLADLYALARIRLAAAGVTAVYGGGGCTYSDPVRFFSYRRTAVTGRMASLIWFA